MILACILCLLSVVVLYALFVIIYPWVTEYNPDEKMILVENSKPTDRISAKQHFSILTWNIGYAGLGKEMDFFYEGGKMVRPDKEKNATYLNGILKFLSKKDTLDFILLQELDFHSKRSYKTNQYAAIQHLLGTYHSIAATNYKSAFVPSPFFEPMGKVDAGQATFTTHNPSTAYRMATPGAYAWPKRIYMLKRCFLISSHTLDNGKCLILFNIHNSAFDDAATLREKELELLKKLAIEEFNKGNYVVVGGDWNQNPPGWKPLVKNKYLLKEVWPIQPDYLPKGWTWGYDPDIPTNRDVNEPFSLNSTPCTLLDFFMVSPNVKIRQMKTLDLEFRHSDHLPVLMTFQLL